MYAKKAQKLFHTSGIIEINWQYYTCQKEGGFSVMGAIPAMVLSVVSNLITPVNKIKRWKKVRSEMQTKQLKCILYKCILFWLPK